MDILIPLVLLVVVFYLFVLRPAQRQQQKTRDLQGGLAVGKRVMLTSGIYGTVDSIDDDTQTFELEVAPDVYISVARQAVAEVFHDDDEVTDEPDDEPVEDIPDVTDVDAEDQK